MGQSKWRKQNDPSYGRRQRGLLVTSRIKIDGATLGINGAGIDPQLLRFGLCFWDKLAYPRSSVIHVVSNQDELFLEKEGILSRPTYSYEGPASAAMLATHLAAFDALQKQRGVTWAFHQGKESFDCPQLQLPGGHEEIALELLRAVPIPKDEVPLDEILDFKRIRAPEFEAFRAHIDGFVESTQTEQSLEDALARYAKEIDESCADLLKTAKQWRWPVYLADIKVGFSLNPFKIARAGRTAWEWAEPYGLKAAAAAAGLGALASCFTVTGQPKIRTNPLSKSPYRYAYHLHHELR